VGAGSLFAPMRSCTIFGWIPNSNRIVAWECRSSLMVTLRVTSPYNATRALFTALVQRPVTLLGERNVTNEKNPLVKEVPFVCVEPRSGFGAELASQTELSRRQGTR